MRLRHAFYDTIALLASLGATGMGLRRRTGPRRREWIRERFGRVDYGPRDLWLHAVSVGETVAALPLVEELGRRQPGWGLLFTTVTETGRAEATRRIPAARIATIPWDVAPIIGKVLGATRPRAVVTLETEIWPAFIRSAKERGIPFLIVNGRISDKSFGRYLRSRPFMEGVFRSVTGFGMQTEEDAERVVRLGAAPGSVAVLGNLKYDVPIPAAGVPGWMGRMGGRVWVVGSTHRGEDEMILDAFRIARESVPDLQLVLAPRHPERFDAVGALVEATGLKVLRRSALGEGGEGDPLTAPVVLLDVMGELSRAYGAASVCFVGGSLVPAGGHNILEAVAWERPVVVGPHMDNFAEMARLFGEVRGLSRVRDAQELGKTVARLLYDTGEASAQAARAAAVLRKHQGAARRAADWILSHVVDAPASR